MRKTIISAVAAAALTAVLCPALSAQSTIQFNPEPLTGNRALGISVGVVTKQLTQGDIKMPWMYLDYLTGDSKAKQSAALQVGLTWSPEFRYGIGLQTGLFYEMSYQSKTMGTEGISVSGSLSDHNLSIPLRVQWRYEIVPDWSVFVYTGPSFDIGVGGKFKQSAEAMGESVATEESIYDPEYGFKRFNMLWGVGAGVRWATGDSSTSTAWTRRSHSASPSTSHSRTSSDSDSARNCRKGKFQSTVVTDNQQLSIIKRCPVEV